MGCKPSQLPCPAPTSRAAPPLMSEAYARASTPPTSPLLPPNGLRLSEGSGWRVGLLIAGRGPAATVSIAVGPYTDVGDENGGVALYGICAVAIPRYHWFPRSS